MDANQSLHIYPDGRINTANAAKMIGLSVKTLATMRCTGTGPAYQKIRGRIYYRTDSVQEWIQRHPKQVSTAQGSKSFITYQ